MKPEVFPHSDLSHTFTMFNMNTVTVYSYSIILLSLLVDLLVVIGDNSKHLNETAHVPNCIIN